jgi:hypothetical protein
MRWYEHALGAKLTEPRLLWNQIVVVSTNWVQNFIILSDVRDQSSEAITPGGL